MSETAVARTSGASAAFARGNDQSTGGGDLVVGINGNGRVAGGDTIDTLPLPRLLGRPATPVEVVGKDKTPLPRVTDEIVANEDDLEAAEACAGASEKSCFGGITTRTAACCCCVLLFLSAWLVVGSLLAIVSAEMITIVKESDKNGPAPLEFKYADAGACPGICTGGPIIPIFPFATGLGCSSTNVLSLSATSFVKGVPQKVKDAMPNAAGLNEMIAAMIAKEGFEDLALEADEDLVQAFDFKFNKLSATWLVGCWPPQRYGLVSIFVSLPRGRLRIKMAGLDFVVNFADFAFKADNLRAELQCHAGNFVLSTLGSGIESKPVDPDLLSVSGSFDIDCGDSLSRLDPVCHVALITGPSVVKKILAMLPASIAEQMNSAPLPLPIAEGCPSLLHNIFTPLAYAEQSCCEAPFATNDNGCLIGGQVNGALRPGLGKNVTGATCSYRGLFWKVNCGSVPGGYRQGAAGLCVEDDIKIPSFECPHCAEAWRQIRAAIHHGLLAFRLFAIGLPLLLCCSCVILLNRWRYCCCPKVSNSQGARELKEHSFGSRWFTLKASKTAR